MLSRSCLALLLVCAGFLVTADTASAQGPPVHVRTAIQRFVGFLESRDDASVDRFMEEGVAESYRSEMGDGLRDHLLTIREAARGGTGGVDLRPGPGEGVTMILENGVALEIGIAEEGVITRVDVAEGGEGAPGGEGEGEVVMEGPPPPVDLGLDGDWASLDDLLAQALEASGAPGAAAAVVKGGRIVERAAVGTREYGRDAPFRAGDRFHWGSVGKSATGTVVGVLIEEGILSSHSTVGEVLGHIPMRDVYRDVTLAELMRHEGGVQPYTDFEGPTIDRFRAYQGTPTEKRAAFVADLLMEEPAHAPGERFQYSNAGVSLAGHMAEVAAGRSWEALVGEYVLRPAGMEGSVFGLPATEESPDQTRGHFVFGSDEPEVVELGAFSDLDPMIAPAGGISSSIDDFARYALFHLQGLREGAGAMSADGFRRIHTPSERAKPIRRGSARYSYGWEVTEWPVPGVEAHWHNGSGGMFYAEIRLFPEEDLGIVVMSNAGGPIAFSGDQIVEALYRRHGEAAVPSATAPLSWDNLEARLQDLARRGLVSGVVLARRGGERVLFQGLGMADRERWRETTPDQAYGIGSAPIDFTVTATYLLAGRGAIDLDASIAEYLPGVPADKQRMTVRMILEGRSGLPDFHHLPVDWDADLAWIDREEAERRILGQPLLFEPGTEQSHSHSAFVLLAAVLERADGRSYREIVRDEIFEPLGMARTGFYGESLGLPREAFAVGYDSHSVGLPNIPPNWGPTSWLVMGSGGMFSTVEDLVRYYDAREAGTLLLDAWAEMDRSHATTVNASDRGFFLVQSMKGNGDMFMLLMNREDREPELRELLRELIGLVSR